MARTSADFLRICTLNVRSISSEVRLTDFESAMEALKFDVVGLSETRISGSSRIDLQSGFSMYNSGNSERGKSGVGFYLRSPLNLCKCIFHSDRIIELILKPSSRNILRIIQVHAPHSGYDDEDYEEFLDILTNVIDRRANAQIIVLGDFNVTPGAREGQERYIGMYASDKRRMLAEF